MKLTQDRMAGGGTVGVYVNIIIPFAVRTIL